MLTTLPTVHFTTVTPALAWMLLKLAGHPVELVITSGTDGQHVHSSAHYRGEAIDVRVIDLAQPADRRARADLIKRLLGPQFQVSLEEFEINPLWTGPHIHAQLIAGVTFAWPAGL